MQWRDRDTYLIPSSIKKKISPSQKKKVYQNGNGPCIQIIELWVLVVDFLLDFKNYDENSHGM